MYLNHLVRKPHGLLLSFFLIISFSSLCQRTVTGVVTDDKGDPLPGVSVLLVGTEDSVTTDLAGRYSIT
ncbi:MAG: carboxypeptidase regulatory-like domain-containing protein, partial [Bacteroidota bacterium]